MNSENGFLSGYDGQFLGMNSQDQQNPGEFLGMNSQVQQNPGEFLGLNRNIQLQHTEPVTYLAGVQNDQMHSFVNMNSSVEGNRSAGGFESENIFRPISLMGSRTMLANENSGDEVEAEDACGTKGKREKDGPWQRMKWTDEIVRLLIQVVASVGDDGGFEVAEGGGKQKSGIMKKGKWKTVSSILITKGYQASPQQCEDKFNDLNKRYKKLNDIIGRGMTCKVVEYPELMEKMPHISPKAKEVVKKLLNSKHLFYEEMCAYHNDLQIPQCNDLEIQFPPRPTAGKRKIGSQAVGQCLKEKEVSDEEEEDFEDEDESENGLSGECGSRDRVVENTNEKRVSGEVESVMLSYSKRVEDLQREIDKIFNDPTKSNCELKEWINKRTLELDEERIDILAEGITLGKQRAKWKAFRDMKEAELEMARLDNRMLIIQNEKKASELKKQKAKIKI